MYCEEAPVPIFARGCSYTEQTEAEDDGGGD